jgi:predicted PurR-regulated permease PerM
MTRLWQNTWFRLAVGIGIVALVVFVLKALGGALTPFVIAFALAYFLNPVVNGLEAMFARRGLAQPRTLAVGLLCVVLVAVIVGFVLFVVPVVSAQIAEAVRKLPQYFANLRARVEPMYARLNLEHPQETAEARDRLIEAVKSHVPEILAPIAALATFAFSSVLSFVLTVLNLLVVPVFAAYLLFDMNRIVGGIRELVPHRLRPYLYSRAREVDRLLSAFVRGQITVALILGAFYSVALTLCGVPLGFVVGFCVGLLNLIPFMSYVIGLPIVLVLSWIDDGDLTRLAVVAAVFTFGQFVEGNFISPRIVGESLGLHAVVIMLAVLAGGTLLGFIGMLIAVPTTAALSVFWKDLRDFYLRSDFYRKGGEPPPGDATIPGDLGHA